MSVKTATMLDTPEAVERYDIKKFFLLGLTFFFVIAAGAALSFIVCALMLEEPKDAFAEEMSA